VDPAVHADLVALVDDATLLVGIQLRDDAGDEERRLDVVALEHVEDARHAGARAVLALRQAPDRGRAFAQRAGLVVRIERQRDAHARVVLPACGFERAPGAHLVDGAAPAAFGPAPGRVVVGVGCHGPG